VDRPTHSRGSSELLLLMAVAVVVLTSFLFKAVHLDDPVYLWVAEQIRQDPADFFGFFVNWHGTRAPVFLVNKNPPLVSYYYALFGWLGVRAEWALHTAAIPIALLAVGGVYALARRLCAVPFAAAGLALATPAFVVSATTLMSDVLMVGCWCLAVWLWIRGLETRSRAALAGSALLVGLCALSKYFGIALIPLLGAYTLLRERRLDPRLAWLLLPLALLAGYEAYTDRLYAHGALSGALRYAAGARARSGMSWLDGGITALSFSGGCLLAASLYGPLLARRLLPVTAAAGLLLVLLLPAALGSVSGVALWSDGGPRLDVLLPLVAFAIAGANVLALAFVHLRREPRNPEAWLLALWVYGTFTFAAFLNWTVNARAVLPMAPALAILAAREWQARGGRAPATRLAPYAVAGLALAVAVARADEEWALSGALAAQTIARSHANDPGSRLFFQGHWGMQFYLEPLRGRAYDRYRDELRPGDWMVVPRNNTNLLGLPEPWVERVAELRMPSSSWITVNGSERGAGFYSSAWGPLPFAPGRAPEEVYELQRVRVPISPAPPRP
jgi:4-amino-4-deoxy-L-arabinose transferase-like glycosyltransferase